MENDRHGELLELRLHEEEEAGGTEAAHGMLPRRKTEGGSPGTRERMPALAAEEVLQDVQEQVRMHEGEEGCGGQVWPDGLSGMVCEVDDLSYL